MGAGQIGQGNIFDVQVCASIGNMRVAGQGWNAHGAEVVVGEETGEEAGCATAVVSGALGLSDCGRVARPCAADSVGRYKGPRCPQALRVATAVTTAAPRMGVTLNMHKLYD